MDTVPYSHDPFGPTLERLMIEQNVTYRGLGDWADLSAGYLHHLIHGKRPFPADDVVERIADAMKISPAVFREYRARKVAELIHEAPAELDRLYDYLVVRRRRRPIAA